MTIEGYCLLPRTARDRKDLPGTTRGSQGARKNGEVRGDESWTVWSKCSVSRARDTCMTYGRKCLVGIFKLLFPSIFFSSFLFLFGPCAELRAVFAAFLGVGENPNNLFHAIASHPQV